MKEMSYFMCVVDCKLLLLKTTFADDTMVLSTHEDATKASEQLQHYILYTQTRRVDS